LHEQVAENLSLRCQGAKQAVSHAIAAENNRKGDSAKLLRISGNDSVLVSRREKTVATGEISDWYRCLKCERITEVPSKDELTKCPHCGGTVVAVAEPFQTTQFSPHIGGGSKRTAYAGAAPAPKAPRSEEAEILRSLYGDPNSRFQAGGTGYLRKPLDEARSTRADAPDWFRHREAFLKTLKPNRAVRAEQILSAFYLGDKTDSQIAETLGWTKDAVKKERADLIRMGNRFFRESPQG
jgi:DNA-directed RNA polymerase subunit RPC12/RpoP